MFNNVNFTGNPAKYFNPDTIYDAAKHLVKPKVVAAEADKATEAVFTTARKLGVAENAAAVADTAMEASYAVSHGFQNGNQVGQLLDKMM